MFKRLQHPFLVFFFSFFFNYRFHFVFLVAWKILDNDRSHWFFKEEKMSLSSDMKC